MTGSGLAGPPAANPSWRTMFFKRTSRERARAEMRAPGSLDFLGGPARYCGSLVLETPVSRQCTVVVEEVSGHAVTVDPDGSGGIELDFAPFRRALERRAPDAELRSLLREAEVPPPALVPLGVLLAFCAARVWVFEEGLRLSIRSEISPGRGLGATAATEIALLRALESVAGRQFLSTEAARIAHRAETGLRGGAGALADKLAPAHGASGALLPVLCRPDKLGSPVGLPGGIRVVAWPGTESGEERRPAARRFRTAAFMGQKVLEQCLGRAWHHAAEIPLSFFLRHAPPNLPLRMKGSLFSELIDTDVTTPDPVYPDDTYDVNAALRFPVEEHFRCGLAVSLLRGIDADNREEVLGQVGELMLQSHEGMGAIGLGSAEADRRVDALRDLGPERGVFGARLCRDGETGTVVALVSEKGLAHARAMAARNGEPGEWVS